MGVVGDIFEGGGAKPFSFKNKGDTIEGEIVQIRSKQLPKFGSETQLETWDNGEPKLTPILTIATSEQENEDDDGKRDVYLRSNAYTAFGKALREAFRTKPEDDDLVGCTIKLQFHAEERSGKGQPRKLFRCRITKKSAADAAWRDAEEAAPANGRPPAMPPGPTMPPDDVPF